MVNFYFPMGQYRPLHIIKLQQKYVDPIHDVYWHTLYQNHIFTFTGLYECWR